MVNIAVLVGQLVKAPQTRALPSGLQLTSFDLRVQRPEEAADTVPVAMFVTEPGAPPWGEGEELVVVGRVRRRFFRAGGGTQSRTEVVADHVVRVAEAEECSEVLARTAAALWGAVGEVGREAPGWEPG
jgi:single-strand DNA-binding protein